MITVFMAVYNGSAYLRESIDSILNQTFKDFELLIINDGSTDNSVDIINSYNDPRIRFLNNSKNEGLVYTRNRGIDEASGEYFAILDCDDIAPLNRLELQYDFMESKRSYAMCGGHSIYINSKGEPTGYKLTLPLENLNAHMLFLNVFVNSTLMIRTSVIKELGGYKNYAPAEDFELSLRIAEKYKVANLDEVLVKYRIHQNNISSIQTEKMVDSECRILEIMHRNLNIRTNSELIETHHQLYTENIQKNNIQKYMAFMEILKERNIISKTYDEIFFNKYLYEKWYKLIIECGGKNGFKMFIKSTLFEFRYLEFKHLRKVFKQSIGIKP